MAGIKKGEGRVRVQQGKAHGDGGEKRLKNLRIQGSEEEEEEETGVGAARKAWQSRRSRAVGGVVS